MLGIWLLPIGLNEKKIKISSNNLFTFHCTSESNLNCAYLFTLFVTNFGTAGWMICLTQVINGISAHRFIAFCTNWVFKFRIFLDKHVDFNWNVSFVNNETRLNLFAVKNSKKWSHVHGKCQICKIYNWSNIWYYRNWTRLRRRGNTAIFSTVSIMETIMVSTVEKHFFFDIYRYTRSHKCPSIAIGDYVALLGKKPRKSTSECFLFILLWILSF